MPRQARACESTRKRPTASLLAVVLLSWLAFGAVPRAQGHAAPAGEPAHAAGAPEGREHGEAPSVWATAGKLVNFAILVGVLVYVGRKPLAVYLASRRTQVRADLEAAEAMKKTAAAQIAEMDAKLKALPAELDQVKARGLAEITAEEQRIRALADVERARLLAQAQHDIEQQVRLARRELIEHAAALSVSVAEQKIKKQITDADQARLVDRYLTQVTGHE